MNTVFLLPEEKQAFQGLDSEITDGYSVQDSTMEYQDSPQKLHVRVSQLHVQDAKLSSLATSLKQSNTELMDVVQQLEEMDLSAMPTADVQNVLYALGPDLLTIIVKDCIASASDASDVEQIAAYSTARHLFFAPLS